MMPTIEKLGHCRIGGTIWTVMAASEASVIEDLARAAVGAGPRPTERPKDTVVVHPVLLKRLRQCGFAQCQGDGDSLSQAQLSAVLADQSVAERIALKQLVNTAGIWPKGTR
jgi:hypothetical protein